MLNMIPGEKHSDYINASYVDVRVTHKLDTNEVRLCNI